MVCEKHLSVLFSSSRLGFLRAKHIHLIVKGKLISAKSGTVRCLGMGKSRLSLATRFVHYVVTTTISYPYPTPPDFPPASPINSLRLATVEQ